MQIQCEKQPIIVYENVKTKFLFFLLHLSRLIMETFFLAFDQGISMDDLATKVFGYKFPSHSRNRKMVRFPFMTTDPLQFMADYTFTFQDGVKWPFHTFNPSPGRAPLPDK